MERCCTTNPLWPYLHLDLHAYSEIKCLWYSNCNMQYMLPHFSNKIYSMPIKRILLINKHALEWKESSIYIYQLLTSENFITASNPNFSLLLKRFAYALFSESPRFYNWISSINWITGIMFTEHRHILWCRAPNHCLFLIHATQSEGCQMHRVISQLDVDGLMCITYNASLIFTTSIKCCRLLCSFEEHHPKWFIPHSLHGRFIPFIH